MRKDSKYDFRTIWETFRDSAMFLSGMRALVIFLGLLFAGMYIAVWFIVIGLAFLGLKYIPAAIIWACVHAFMGGVLYRVYRKLEDKYDI